MLSLDVFGAFFEKKCQIHRKLRGFRVTRVCGGGSAAAPAELEPDRRGGVRGGVVILEEGCIVWFSAL